MWHKTSCGESVDGSVCLCVVSSAVARGRFLEGCGNPVQTVFLSWVWFWAWIMRYVLGAGGEVLAAVEPLCGTAGAALCRAQLVPPQDGHVCAALCANVLKEGQNAAQAVRSGGKEV